MTEQKRRFEDQLPGQRIDWEHGGEPSSDPIRIERQQALLNYAAGLLKAEGAACSAVVFPGSSPEQYILIGTADDILRLLPLPGATDGVLRSQIRDLTTLLIDRQPADHLLDDPDLVRLVAAITAMAVRSSAGTPLAATPAAGQAGLAKLVRYNIDSKGLPFGDKDGVWVAYDDVKVLLAAPVAAATEQAKIPTTPGEAIAFIGGHFDNCEEDAANPENTRFRLSVHDLLSAFRWWFDTDAAPLATPADAGAGQVLTDQRIGEMWMELIHLDRYDRVNPFARAIEREVLARLSTPGAPVTAEPAQSIDTPEFRALMDAFAEAWFEHEQSPVPGTMEAEDAARAAVIKFIASHSAPAIRDQALKNAIVASLNNWETEMEGYAYFGSNPGVKHDDYEDIADEVVAILKTEGMERAADAKGGAA